MLLFPPEYFRTGVTCRGTTRQLGNNVSALSIYVFDIWLAPHIKPRVKACYRIKFLINRTYACHLTAKAYGDYISRVNSACRDTFLHGLCSCGEKVVIFLVNNAGFWIVNRYLRGRFGNQFSIAVIEGRFCATGT